jgi:HSP20 family protein
MAIVKWESFGDMDRFFEDFAFPPMPSMSKMGFDLAVDVYDDKENIIAEMNLPGIDPAKVNVSVEDNHLRITGAREEEKEEKKKNYYSKEIRRGSFERTVRLPERVEKEKVKAAYENGVLKVTLPKSHTSESAKIEIEVKK